MYHNETLTAVYQLHCECNVDLTVFLHNASLRGPTAMFVQSDTIQTLRYISANCREDPAGFCWIPSVVVYSI